MRIIQGSPGNLCGEVGMDTRRRSLVFAITLGFFLFSIIVMPEPVVAGSHTWTTDVDWNAGTMHNLVVKDVGDPSYLELWNTTLPAWVRMNPSTVPPNRDGYCLVWAPSASAFVMFGGRGPSGMLNDTWKYIFNRDTWVNLTPRTSPPPLWNPGCEYDPVSAVVVLFGGRDGTGTWRNETWWFNTTSKEWIHVFPSRSPANIQETPLVYDRRSGNILTLFQNSVTWEMETWMYDVASNMWTNLHPALSVTPRRNRLSIVQDEGWNKTLLFAGATNNTLICDIWEFDSLLNNWEHIRDCIPNIDPPKRVGHGMAYWDTFGGGLGGDILFGGADDIGTWLEDMWIYIAPVHQWIQLIASGNPGGRTNISLAHNPVENATLLFGGFRDVEGLLNDTWVLVGEGYLPYGRWMSDVLDLGSSMVELDRIWFNQTPATKPPGTTLRFRIAVADSPSGPWFFAGPGGFPGSYYTLPGQSIDPIHDGRRYLRVRAELIGNLSTTPRLEDITIIWMSTSSPWIVDTNPADRQTLVPPDASIWVNFSEPMDIVTVNWTIAPAITLKAKWYNVNQTLLLTHVAPFQVSTAYTVHITGKDANDGYSLIPGPVPNPWTFSTVASMPPPGNLTVTISGPDIVLSWDPVPGAISYCISESSDSSAPFPSGWSLLGIVVSSPFVVPLHGSDGLTHFYIVRVCDGIMEGSNSTMGVKKAFSFTHSPTTSNIQWFSIPYKSIYTKASDIANELTSSKIDVVGKWDPAQQRASVYYYARGMWRGTDFNLNPGDGLYLSIRRSFELNITGTDANVTLMFTPNPAPKANVFWTGILYTGIYSRASDIANELTSNKIHEVGLWNPATQTTIRWFWNGTAWTGTDFTFECGAGIYIIAISDFTWTPTLITPVVA